MNGLLAYRTNFYVCSYKLVRYASNPFMSPPCITPSCNFLERALTHLQQTFSTFHPKKLFHRSSSPTKLFITLHSNKALHHSFISNETFLILIVYWLAVAPSLSTPLSPAATPTPASYVCWCSLLLSVSPFYFACYAVLSTAMDSNQAKPTADQVKEWDGDKLLGWIKKNRPTLFKDDQLKKLEQEDISGNEFLDRADDVGFFKNICGLTAGASIRLVNLAEAGGETAGIKSKLLSSSMYTLVDSKLTALQETESRPEMWKCPPKSRV